MFAPPNDIALRLSGYAYSPTAQRKVASTRELSGSGAQGAGLITTPSTYSTIVVVAQRTITHLPM